MERKEMNKRMMVLLKGPSNHVEHFSANDRKWHKCQGTVNKPCPFIAAPHRVASEVSCSCGKTMDEFIAHLDEMHEEIERRIRN